MFSYDLPLTNGAAAAGSGDDDVDSEKDLVARAFVRPFAQTGIEPLEKLGVGVGASAGEHTGTPQAPQLMTLATSGGLTFFSYLPSALASGASSASRRT